MIYLKNVIYYWNEHDCLYSSGYFVNMDIENVKWKGKGKKNRLSDSGWLPSQVKHIMRAIIIDAIRIKVCHRFPTHSILLLLLLLPTTNITILTAFRYFYWSTLISFRHLYYKIRILQLIITICCFIEVQYLSIHWWISLII